MTNPIEDIENCGAIFVIGANPTKNHPIIGYRIRRAIKKGAKLIVADPLLTELAEKADVFLQLKPGTDVALLNGLLNAVFSEGLEDKGFIAKRTLGCENFKEFVQTRYPLHYVSEITGVPAAEIIDAARLFATAPSAGIFYCMGITQHTSGTENVLALTNLALATGNVGKPNAGINPLRGQNNVQGACDMGCLPHVLPGYQPVHSDGSTYWQRLGGSLPSGEAEMITALEFDPDGKSPRSAPGDRVSDEIRAKFSRAWGVELSDIPGRTINDMFHPNPDRWCKALYIMGENPALSSPDGQHVRKALEGLEFLVVQDIFLTETAQLADVVLPAASFAEQSGTFINTERRVQRIRRAIEPSGQSRPDWEIIQALAQKLGFPWNFQSEQAIWDEVRRLAPHYFGGMSYERLEKQGLQWPCPTADHLGTAIMHRRSWRGEEDYFARGMGLFSMVDYRPFAAERANENYPFTLTTARNLYQFHTRTMTGRVAGLNEFFGEEAMLVNPMDADRLGIRSGETVKVSSPRGSIETKIQVSERVPLSVVSMTFHFAQAAANVLTNPAVCSLSVASAVKVCSVSIEKIEW